MILRGRVCQDYKKKNFDNRTLRTREIKKCFRYFLNTYLYGRNENVGPVLFNRRSFAGQSNTVGSGDGPVNRSPRGRIRLTPAIVRYRHRKRRQRSQQLRRRVVRLPDAKNDDGDFPDERQFPVHLPGLLLVQRCTATIA